jgi:hypothetical protein
MQYVRLGEFFAVSRITGPSHNLLQMRLSNSPQGPIICEQLSATGVCRHGTLNEDAIAMAVLEGVTLANSQLGSSYVVSHIRYVENDTPPETVYGMLAVKILQHVHSGGVFVPGSAPRA